AQPVARHRRKRRRMSGDEVFYRCRDTMLLRRCIIQTRARIRTARENNRSCNTREPPPPAFPHGRVSLLTPAFVYLIDQVFYEVAYTSLRPERKPVGQADVFCRQILSRHIVQNR